MTHKKVVLARLMDTLVLLWIMPPLGFFITLIQVPEFKYLNANHTLIAILAVSIYFRWLVQAPNMQLACRLVITLLLLCLLLGVEWLHFLAGKPTIDNLTDLRLLIYSPLYGSVIIFLLYGLYLAMLQQSEQQRHLIFFIKLICWFNVIFLVYWLLLYSGYFSPISKTDLLNSNSIAYGSLFVVAVTLLYKERIGSNILGISIFSVVNITVILINSSRGAFLGLVVLLAYWFLQRQGSHRGIKFLSAVVCLVLLMILEFLFFKSSIGLEKEILDLVFYEVGYAYNSNKSNINIVDLDVTENTLSSLSRIGSIYYTALIFADNPLLGIGQADSYEVNVIGSGVHSLFFLLVSSTGLVGLILFICTILVLNSTQGYIYFKGRHVFMLALCLIIILFFVNSIPIYFALIFTVLGLTINPTKQFGHIPVLPIQNLVSTNKMQ